MPLVLWQLSVSLRPLVQAQGSCSAFEVSWSSAMPPFLGRDRVTARTTATTSPVWVSGDCTLNQRSALLAGLLVEKIFSKRKDPFIIK